MVKRSIPGKRSDIAMQSREEIQVLSSFLYWVSERFEDIEYFCPESQEYKYLQESSEYQRACEAIKILEEEELKIEKEK